MIWNTVVPQNFYLTIQPKCQDWHITHRCHKREFLLKFSKDCQRWIQWLFEAKRQYGLPILNYVVTSNHIHLLGVDDKDRMTIPKAIQLIAGRIAQEYNQRKNPLAIVLMHFSFLQFIWKHCSAKIIIMTNKLCYF